MGLICFVSQPSLCVGFYYIGRQLRCLDNIYHCCSSHYFFYSYFKKTMYSNYYFEFASYTNISITKVKYQQCFLCIPGYR